MSADLALASDPSVVERAADPAEFIIQSCERAKAWLREALDHGDIDAIAECKSQAEAIRVYTMSKQLGKDAQLSATEIVRRAERGIGVAIRRGQEAGTITIRGEHRGNQYTNGNVDQEDIPKPKVTGYVTRGELYGGGKRAGIFDITDHVTDDQFEEALTAAKDDGDLSRSNVFRKLGKSYMRRQEAQPEGDWVPAPGAHRPTDALQRRKLMKGWAERGYNSRQMAERLGMRDDAIRRIGRECGIEIPADAIVSRTKRHDSNQIIEGTVHALEGLAMGIQLVDPADLDPSQAKDWATSLTSSIRQINALIKKMKEITRASQA